MIIITTSTHRYSHNICCLDHTFTISSLFNFFSMIMAFSMSKMATAISRWKFLQGIAVQITSHNLPRNRKENLMYCMEKSSKFILFIKRTNQEPKRVHFLLPLPWFPNLTKSFLNWKKYRLNFCSQHTVIPHRISAGEVEL